MKLLNNELQENEIIKCKFESCNFELNDSEGMIQHLEECPKKPEQVRFNLLIIIWNHKGKSMYFIFTNTRVLYFDL